MRKILTFPDLRQTYNFDCGASALQSVFVYYGIRIREDKLMKMLETKEAGTSVQKIISVSQAHRLEVDAREMTLVDIKSYIDKAIPVVVPMQAWTDTKGVDWKQDWEDGHYVIVVGYDEKNLYFEDPSTFVRSFLAFDEFSQRWHDTDEKRKYNHYGIAIFGKEPWYDSRKVVHMD